MSGSIQEEIAQRLGYAPEDVAPVLDAVIQRIRQQVAHYGYARLAGLGAFRDRDGVVVFEPDAALKETVNARYAGLGELVLEPVGPAPDAVERDAFEPAAEEDEEDAIEPVSDADEAEAPWTERDRADEERPSEAEAGHPFEEADYSVLGEQEDDEDVPTVAWAPLGESEGELHVGDEEPALSADAGDMDERAGPDAGDTADVPPDEAARQREEDAASRQKSAIAPDRPAHPHGLRSDAPRRTTDPTARRASRQPSRKTIWLGVGIIVFVAAAAIAYFVLPRLQDVPSQPETAQTETPALPDTASAASADTAAAALTDTPAAADADVPADDEAEAADAAAPAVQPPPTSAPLRSDAGIDRAQGGYTIVVHSETNSSLAQNAAQRFRDQGFRTSVLDYQDEGVTRYRVGVGQFETLEEATQARNELAGNELPDDAWIYRL